jgi:hypothetical protein
VNAAANGDTKIVQRAIYAGFTVTGKERSIRAETETRFTIDKSARVLVSGLGAG